METLREAIKNQIESRPYDGSHSPGFVTLRIWDGPCLDNNNNIFQSKGYYKDTHTVYACLKDRYKALISGRYHFPQSDIEVVERLLFKNTNAYLKEIFNRNTQSKSSTINEQTNKPKDPNIGVVINPGNNDSSTKKNRLVELLVFYFREVIRCSVDSTHGLGLDKLSTGGKIIPEYIEIKAAITSSGYIEAQSVQFIPSQNFPPEVHRAAPLGGGETLSHYRQRSIEASIQTGPLGTASAKIQRTTSNVNDLYRLRCLFNEPHLAKDGDVWIEGVRSSIANRIYQIWLDDIGGGPMLSMSRNYVRNAAARYYWDIDPTEKRYASKRENPLSDTIHSNCITPVQTYIDDWFSDPNLYAGIINVIINLLSGLDKEDNSVKYKEKYLDIGAFDYGKFQQRLEGRTI